MSLRIGSGQPKVPVDITKVLSEIDSALAAHAEIRKKSRHNDMSDRPEDEQHEVATLLLSTLARLSPPGSVYRSQAERHSEENWQYPSAMNQNLPGVLRALRADYVAGRLQAVEEILHADMLSDFLEMSHELSENGFQDAAIVLAGGSLEEHLRNLCAKHAIAITSSSGKPKALDAMNSELAGLGIISKTDQKSITAWAGLRNDAAHGHHGKHLKPEVSLMIAGVRDFISRMPA